MSRPITGVGCHCFIELMSSLTPASGVVLSVGRKPLRRGKYALKKRSISGGVNSILFWPKISSTSPRSVQPANDTDWVASGRPNSSSNACPKAFTPAPLVLIRVPSISNKTSRNMGGGPSHYTRGRSILDGEQPSVGSLDVIEMAR